MPCLGCTPESVRVEQVSQLARSYFRETGKLQNLPHGLRVVSAFIRCIRSDPQFFRLACGGAKNLELVHRRRTVFPYSRTDLFHHRPPVVTPRLETADQGG